MHERGPTWTSAVKHVETITNGNVELCSKDMQTSAFKIYDDIRKNRRDEDGNHET